MERISRSIPDCKAAVSVLILIQVCWAWPVIMPDLRLPVTDVYVGHDKLASDRLEACLSTPCQGGRCVADTYGGFRCFCPIIMEVNITRISSIGSSCEKYKGSSDPVITNLTPLFGPIAGGTNITITGRHFRQIFAIRVVLGHFRRWLSSVNVIEDTVAYFLTPQVDEYMKDRSLSIELYTINGISNKPIETQFTFKGNPDITDIRPMEHFTSGGTSLTVSGFNMDAVAKPALKITQIYTILFSAAPPAVFAHDTTTYYSVCSLKNQQSMICQMPKLDLPRFITDTKRDAINPTTLPHLHRIVRNARSNGPIQLQNGNSSLGFVFGFVLDGVDKFENITASFPGKAFAFFLPPTFKTWTDVLLLERHKNPTISIEGDGMLRGARITDYEVNIGLSQCTVLNVFNNIITCVPPSDEPKHHPSDITRCGQYLFAVVVQVGFSENSVGCMSYRGVMELTEPVITSPDITEPVTTSLDITEPVTTSLDSTEPVTTSLVSTEWVITSLDSTEQVTTSPDITYLVTTNQDNTEPVITNQDNTEPVITSPEITEPVITNQDNTEPVITNQDNTEPVITSPDITEPVTTSLDSTEPVTTSPDIRYLVTTNIDNTKPVTTSLEITQPVITNQDITEPVITNQDNSEPVLTNLDIIEPLITNLTPLFGPVAGGTNITLTGRHFSKFLPYIIHMGSFTGAVTSGIVVQDTVAYFRSPPANESAVDVKLPVSVEFMTGIRYPLQFRFLYKGNPDISDIHPVEHIISGGTALTVSGSNMDAVAKPVLKITQIYTFLSLAGPPVVFDQDTTKYYSVCSLKNQQSIICQMPKLDLPAEFITDTERRRRETEQHRLPVYHSGDTMNANAIMIDGLRESELSPGNLTYRHLEREATSLTKLPDFHRIVRKKRSSGQIPAQKGDSRLEFFYGFMLDGIDKFENISQSLPEKALTFFATPTFKTWREVIVFEPFKITSITIKGQGMLRGATMTDYTVKIGLSQCVVKNLVDNLLTCAPPSDMPEYHSDDITRCGEDLFALMVLVGFSENLVGCVEYRLTSGMPLLYVVLGSCGGGIILLLLVVCLVICLCNKRKSTSPKDRRQKKTKSIDDELMLDERLREIKGPYGVEDLRGPEPFGGEDYLHPMEPLTPIPQPMRYDSAKRSSRRP